MANFAPERNRTNYSYDSSGNFLSKGDYGQAYYYDQSRPHVVDSVNLHPGFGTGTADFDHDDNGNLIDRDGVTLTYTAFNKPQTIQQGGNQTTFSYGADLMRYRQTTPSGSRIYYLDKLMEIETLGAAADFRHYLGDVAILTKTGDLNDPSPGIQYLLRDRLGSVAAIGSTTGIGNEARGYDPFGKPRNGDWSDKSPPSTQDSDITDRGFTDHEHLDDWQLIHMNGRGYDYNLGRFLSVDPIIQSPGNSQSLNPFAYIMNNPLSGTDPSGYACSSTDTVADCEAGIKKGTTTKIRDDSGKIVGRVGKDRKGNLFITNNGKLEGRNAILAAKQSGFSGTKSDEIGSLAQNASPITSWNQSSENDSNIDKHSNGLRAAGASPEIDDSLPIEKQLDILYRSQSTETQKAIRDHVFENRDKIFSEQEIYNGDLTKAAESANLVAGSGQLVLWLASRSNIVVTAMDGSLGAFNAYRHWSMDEKLWDYNQKRASFNLWSGAEIFDLDVKGVWREFNWGPYHSNRPGADMLAVDTYLFVTDQVGKKPPICVINGSCDY